MNTANLPSYCAALLVGWSQDRFPVVSLDFSVMPLTMTPESTQLLVKMSTRNIPGGKGGRYVRLTTYHPTVPFSLTLGAWTSRNSLGLSRYITGQLYFFPSYCNQTKTLTVFMLERCSTQQSACWYLLLTADQGTGSDPSICFAVMPGYCILKNTKTNKRTCNG
jgi:hypothetical protein